ncbi:hypothetical protein KFK09_029322 [Dendrobium nobile]|uniref:Uncharacterized protein n=1 Tax=Dendrobium nobile TaxID=94219 RepID=A0A8T3A0W8_DENNO|nr:hypothetical protein KFK09_029322 [Dendrobium nobile]
MRSFYVFHPSPSAKPDFFSLPHAPGRENSLRTPSALLPAAPPAGAAPLRRSGNFRPPSRSTPHWILGIFIKFRDIFCKFKRN